MEKLYSINIRYMIHTIRQEGWPFFFICVYLFFEYVRPQSIYGQMDFLPYVPIIIALAFVTALLNQEFGRQSPSLISKLMVVYAAIVLFSSAFSQYPGVSFSNWRSFFDWLLIYFLIVSIVTNEKRFFIFFLSFLVYSLKMSQHGFLSWAKRGFAYAHWGVTGAPGWFHNSGEVGIQMCIFVPLAIAFIIGIYKHLSKPWLAFFLLMPITGIGTAIASTSRGAMVGLAGAGSWMILRRPRVFIAGALVLIAVAWVVIRVMPEEFAQRFETMGEDRTSIHRIERIEHGIEAMNRHPFFGVGFEAWSDYYPRNFYLKDQGTLLVHNVFVQCGSELGYPGLMVFCAMILACFMTTKKVRNLARGHPDRFFSILSYGFDGALVGFLISGSFVTVLYYPYFWIHCALTVCLYTASVKKYAGGSEISGSPGSVHRA